MKISVDPERCYGSGDCVYRVPSVFTVVDGFGAVLPGREDAGDDPAVRSAAEGCPSQAITLGRPE
ncbi:MULTISPECIES: ferredoxin [unclassified Streptomyces]|uniref:ferredoxin n=1 Tax=unclassified Streptomyces TaxID=2593676 RepID=UPI001F04F687|nr:MULTISPECIES: ferredoxin [unclassified Streptomyces]MCH0562874.1 ferredoxin [Streptomyces sp. MUM 2J]MCH0572775.1 ferredoxin [Streptomyces sp. MUM 136J]